MNIFKYFHLIIASKWSIGWDHIIYWNQKCSMLNALFDCRQSKCYCSHRLLSGCLYNYIQFIEFIYSINCLMPFETIRWSPLNSPIFAICVLLFAHFFQLTVYLISLCHTIYLTVFINILPLFFISCFLSLHRLRTCVFGWLVGINNNLTHKINDLLLVHLILFIRLFILYVCLCAQNSVALQPVIH